MTVADNLSFPLRVGRRTGGAVAIEQEVQRVAGILGLQALLQRRPRELSGGQRQRVALGRAIIRQPRVFLLDEPLSNLDTQLRAGMRAELRALHDQLGITMIYVTHDQIEAMTLADRLAVLDRGQIQQIGTPQELYRRPANLFVAGFLGQPPMNLLAAQLAGSRIVAAPIDIPMPSWFRTAIEDAEASAGAVILGLRPEEVRISSDQGPGAFGPVRVRLVEPAVGQTWITVDLTGVDAPPTMVGLAEAGAKIKPGDTVWIALHEARPHLFDAGTGRRLDRDPGFAMNST
jgi:ABC-type sugar transport system ATPase subunit